MKKAIKIILTILSIIILLLALTLFAAPRYAKSYLEKNSKELIGRQVDVGMIRLNFFTMTLVINDFVMYEANDEDVFVSFNKFRVNVKALPALKGEYTVSSLLLDELKVNVAFDGSDFNFEDFIEPTDSVMPEEEVPQELEVEVNDTVAGPLKLTLKRVKIRQSAVCYKDSKEGFEYNVSDINFELPEFKWDGEKSQADLKLSFHNQGDLKLRAEVHHVLERFSLTFSIDDFDLAPFSPYVSSYLATSGIEGKWSNTITVDGSLVNTDDVIVSGVVELKDFLINDDQGEAVVKQERMEVGLDSIDLLNSYFGIGKVLISGTEVNAALYQNSTNFDQLMLPMTEAAAADTLPDEGGEGALAQESEESDSVFFYVDSVIFEKGTVFFADHTLNRPFKYKVSDINVTTSGISPVEQNVPIYYSLLLNNDGKLNGNASISMTDPDDLEYSAELRGLNLKTFSPYSEFYIARPIKRGNMSFDGKAKMTSAHFHADNEIHINDIELGEKTQDEPRINMPVKLALAILKDKNGDVEIDVPMDGNPSDPNFSIAKLIGKTLTDFVLKVAATPFAVVGDVAGVNPERLEEIPLAFMQEGLSDKEIKILEQIALALEKKPELKFRFTLEIPAVKEMQSIALARVKTDYLKALDTPEDELQKAVKKLKDNDSGLLAYAQQRSGLSMSKSLGEHCVAIVGEERLKQEILALDTKRNKALSNYLLQTLKVNPDAVVVRTADVFNERIETKYPRYSVEVSVK